MKSHFNLGRAFGVEVGVHASFFAVAALLGASLVQRFALAQPSWTRAAVWSAAAAGALLFFASLLVHELAHAVTARRRGLPVDGITLFALGGLSRLHREPADPGTELAVGVVGPVASAALGAGALAIAPLAGDGAASPAGAVLAWVGYVNLALAAFNMVPGFPLDGGRVLRAVAWWTTGDRRRATRLAAACGQTAAVGLIALGVLQVVRGGGLPALWLALIGWFLHGAARTAWRDAAGEAEPKAVRAGELVSAECPTLSPTATLEQAAFGLLSRQGRRCVVVAEHGRVLGLLTVDQLARVARVDWCRTVVGQVMRPLKHLPMVAPSTLARECLVLMRRYGLQQLPVIDHGRLLGFVSRAQVLRGDPSTAAKA